MTVLCEDWFPWISGDFFAMRMSVRFKLKFSLLVQLSVQVRLCFSMRIRILYLTEVRLTVFWHEAGWDFAIRFETRSLAALSLVF